MTTIKVSAPLRDRLNAQASAEGRTAGSMVERLLDAYLWRREIELAKERMRAAPNEVWDDYMAEFRTMDGSLADLTGDHPS